MATWKSLQTSRISDKFFNFGPKFIGFLIWIDARFQSVVGHIEKIYLISLNWQEFFDRIILMSWPSANGSKLNLSIKMSDYFLISFLNRFFLFLFFSISHLFLYDFDSTIFINSIKCINLVELTRIWRNLQTFSSYFRSFSSKFAIVRLLCSRVSHRTLVGTYWYWKITSNVQINEKVNGVRNGKFYGIPAQIVLYSECSSEVQHLMTSSSSEKTHQNINELQIMKWSIYRNTWAKSSVWIAPGKWLAAHWRLSIFNFESTENLFEKWICYGFFCSFAVMWPWLPQIECFWWRFGGMQSGGFVNAISEVDVWQKIDVLLQGFLINGRVFEVKCTDFFCYAAVFLEFFIQLEFDIQIQNSSNSLVHQMVNSHLGTEELNWNHNRILSNLEFHHVQPNRTDRIPIHGEKNNENQSHDQSEDSPYTLTDEQNENMASSSILDWS